MEYVDDLGDVGHFQTVGVFMEYVQGQGGNESVAHGILLVKMAVDGSGFFVPPGTPFVKHQGYVLFRVVLIHDRDMLFYHIFYFQAFPHCPVIIVFVEICCRAFAAVPTGNGVVM